MNDDDEIWDEFKWEEFMKEQDRMVDRFMELFYRYQNDPNRDQIIAGEMGWAHFLDDGKDECEERCIDDDEDCDEGEEWKELLEDKQFAQQQESAFDDIPVCRKSKEYALRVLKVIDSLPQSVRDSKCVVDFVSNALIASAKVAGGTDLGEDAEDLGANIAFCKRGLAASNHAINALTEIKRMQFIEETIYLDLMKEAVGVRNEIAIYVSDLREKFRNGRA